MAASATILIVSDDAGLRRLLRDLLEDEQILVLESRDGDGAMRAAKRKRPQLILLDAIVGRPDALTLLERLAWSTRPDGPLPVVLLAGSAASPDLLQHASVVESVHAPFAAPELLGVLRRHLMPVTGRSHTRLRAATPDPDVGARDEASSDD